MKEQKTRIRRKNIGYKKLVLLLIIIFIAVFLLFKIVPTTARYVYSVVRSFYLSSREFYFNSNRMSDTGSHFIAENWDGMTPYEIGVEMNSIKNANVKAPMDITYNVKMSYKLYHANNSAYTASETAAAIECVFSNDLIATAEEGVMQGNILASGFNSNIDTFRIIVTKKTAVTLDDDDYVLIELEANSISPYKERIYGDFKITIGNLGLSYKIEDSANEPYLKAIVTNTLGTSKTITLSFDPDYVVFDNTLNYETQSRTTSTGFVSENVNDTVNTYTFTDSITFLIDAEESKTIRFYKKDSTQNYTYPNGSGAQTPIVTFSYI